MISYHSIVCKKWIGCLINVALVYTPPSNKRRTRITKNLINAPVFNRINAVSENNSNGKKTVHTIIVFSLTLTNCSTSSFLFSAFPAIKISLLCKSLSSSIEYVFLCSFSLPSLKGTVSRITSLYDNRFPCFADGSLLLSKWPTRYTPLELIVLTCTNDVIATEP